MLISMIPVFATGDNYIGDNYNDNLYDDKNFEPVSVGMDLSVEAKDEIQLKLELAQESDDLVFEVEAMREENVKHFHLGDGSFQAVSYGSAVHRKDADGKWQDIDNTLALQNVKGTNRYSAPNSRVTFADAFSASSNIMTLRESGYSVSFSLITNEKTNNALAKVSNHEARSSQLDLNDATTKLDSLKAIDNKTSIKYENILNSIDLEYVLISNNIKENIIVKEALDNYSFTFTLEVEGLVAKLNEYGIINLYDTKSGKEVYTIPAPFMFDAKNELSYDVFYTLKEQSSGKYELTVTADEKWINADDRAFPVTIDPTINTTTAVWDTTVTSIAKNNGYGTLQIITLNQQSTGLIYINMPTLPSGSTISSAYLNAAYYVTGGSSGYVTIGAYQMNGRWTEGTSGSYPAPHPPITGNTPNATSTGSTWNSLNSAYGSSLGISSLLSTVNAVASPSVTRNNPAWISFNVTSAVGSWYSGTVNNGIALKNLGGTLSTAAIIAWEAYNEYSAYYTITYEVPVASGVYALNLAGTSRYMQSISSSGGYYASQTTHSSPPLGASTRSSMFKVIAVGNNEYIIRSMTNSELVMRPYYSGTPGVITSSPIPKDSDVPSAYKWKITQASDGYYYISNVNGSTTYYMYMPSSGSIRLTTNINTSGTKWGLPKYTGTDINGVEWTSFNSSFIVGETFTYSAYMYSSVIGRNGPVIYSVSDSTVANININTGYLTTLKPGIINQWVTYDGAPWMWGKSVTINSRFFIECYNNEGLLDVSLGATSQTLECNERSQSSRAFWFFEHKGNGFYTIKNLITDRYIAESGGTVKHLAGSGSTANEQWSLLEQSDGTYKIESKSKPGYFITEENVSHSSYDPSIILSTASSSNKDKWHLKQVVININIFYDNALMIKYGSNNYEQTEAFLKQMGNKLRTVYMDVFGVVINLTYNQYFSLPDICVAYNGTNLLTGMCPANPSLGGYCAIHNQHSAPSTYDCTTRTQALTHLVKLYPGNAVPSTGNPFAISALFTGHACYKADGSIVYRSMAGGSNGIFIQRDYTSTAEYIERATGALVHEVAHIARGAKDHYCAEDGKPCSRLSCVKCYPNNKYSSNCIMYGNHSYHLSMRSEDFFCSGCISDINSRMIEMYN